jgi:Spy/CpxP family protein refolding chaperone
VQSEREEFGKQLQGHAEALGELYEDPNASAAQADAIWDDFYRDMESHHDQILDRRDELKAHVTASEWSAIFAPDAQE